MSAYPTLAPYILRATVLNIKVAIWRTPIGGPVAITASPRRQLGIPPAKNVPVYFCTSFVLAIVLLLRWAFGHPRCPV